MGLYCFSISFQTDGEPPEIECPDDIIQPTDYGQSTTSIALSVNTTDNVGVTGLNCTDQNGRTVLQGGSNSFYFGYNTVTCNTSDVVGLTASCNFTVTITGNTLSHSWQIMGRIFVAVV